MRTPRTERVEIAGIVIEDRPRGITQSWVKEICEDIQSQGQLQPIVVNDIDGRMVLIDGWHRLEAMRSLGQELIRAEVHRVSKLEAQMMALRINLKRNDLTDAQRVTWNKQLAVSYAQWCKWLLEHKEKHDTIAPETRHGGAPGNPNAKGKAPRIKDCGPQSLITYTAQMALETGRPQNTIQKALKVAREGVADAVLGTPIEDSPDIQVQLSRMQPDKRALVIQAFKDGAKTMREALAMSGEEPQRQRPKPQRLVERDREVEAALEAGEQPVEIAERLGIPTHAVQSSRVRLGIPAARTTTRNPLKPWIERAWGAQGVWDNLSEDDLLKGSAEHRDELLAAMVDEQKANVRVIRLLKKLKEEGL